MKKQHLSQRGYAAHRRAAGLPSASLRATQKALKEGRIAAGADGLIDVAAADAAWDAGVSPDARVRRDVALMTKGKPPKKSPSASKTNDTFLIARARTERARAETAELDLAERRGEMVNVAEVELELAKIVLAVRSQFLMLPGKASARVITMTALEAQEYLRLEIRRILTALSQGLKVERKGKTKNAS